MRLKIYESLENVREHVINSGKFGSAKHAEWINEGESLFAVFESYSLFNSNYMSISIVASQKNGYTDFHFVPAGAAQGWIFKFDYGSSSRRLGVLYGLLNQLNYHYDEIQ